MDLYTFEQLRPPLRFMKDIAADVAERHGLTVKDLTGRGRTRHLSHARFEAFWLCRQEKRSDGLHRWSLPAIGRFFGRDHTTVLHGCGRHEELMALREAA